VAFNTLSGTSISIADIDAGGQAVQVTITAGGWLPGIASGTLSLGSTAGLAFSVGDGTGNDNMTFTGTVAAVNAALQTLTYTPRKFFNGPTTVTVAVDDLGNTPAPNRTGSGIVNIDVSLINDAPVNTVPVAQIINEDTLLTFSAGNGNQISIDDNDAGNASVRITLSSTNGSLTLSGVGGLTFLSGGDGTASMQLTGTMTAINAALNGMVFTPTADYFGPASVSITTNDLGNSGTGGPREDNDTVSITINSVDDPPIVQGVVAAISYTENGAPMVVDAGLQVTDVDSPLLSGATVRILNFDAGDRLAFSSFGGITGSYVPATGILTLSGNAAAADYQLVFRSITYVNLGDDPSTLQRTIRFQATDDTGVQSAAADVFVNITAVNDRPVIAPIANVEVNQNGAIPVIQVTLSDLDTILNNITLVATSDTQGVIPDGNIIVGGSGANRTLTITALPGTAGLVTISLIANDGTDDSQTVTFTIDINDPPTITQPANFAVDEDSPPVFVTVTVGDSETPPQNLVVTATSSAPGLVTVAVQPIVSASDRDIKLTFAANLSGPVDITLRVSDGRRFTVVTFHVDVNPVNDVPVVTTQTVTVREDDTIVITVAGDDGDPDKVENLSFEIYVDPFFGPLGPFSGTVQHVAGSNTFIYTPGANFSGLDGFLFVVTDDGTAGSGGPLTSAPNWVFIDVTPVADAPTVSGPAGGIVGTEDTNVPLGVLVGLSDGDGSELISNVTIDLVPPNVFIVKPDGSPYLSTPGAGGLKSYSLSYSDFLAARVYARDNGGGSFRVTVTSSELNVPAIVGDRTATTVITVPLQFANQAPRISGLSGTDVDVNSETTLTATILDAPGDTFTVTITWGVSKIGFTQQTFLGVLGPKIAAIVETFQFLIAPDPQNPAAPIQIIMEVRDDDGGLTTQTIVVQVPGTGIPTTIIREFGFSESRTTVPFIVPPRPAESRIWTTPYQPTSEFGRILSERVNVATRAVLLRIVSARGVESLESYRLSAAVLVNLPGFLGKLPDGHYRLYLSENEFTPERMLVDVVVFRGRAVAPGDVQADRPPNRRSADAQFDSGAVPATVPAIIAEYAPRDEPVAAAKPSEEVPAQAQREVRRLDGLNVGGPNVSGPAVEGPILGGKQDR